MLNNVATPILTINGTAVNKISRIRRAADFALDNDLVIFDNLRAHSKWPGGENHADYRKTTKSIGLHQALF